MKNMKKVLSLLMAMVMILGVFAPSIASAAAPTKTNTVNLHKLLMDDATLTSWDYKAIETKGYDGTQNFEALKGYLGENVNVTEIPNVYFAVQNEQGQWIDANGTVVNSVDQALGGLTEKKADGTYLSIDTSKLPQDEPTKYKIVEVKEKSTYVGTVTGDDGKEYPATLSKTLAVPVEITLPLVNTNGVQETVHVYPKNTEVGKPEHNKTIGDDAKTLAVPEGLVDKGETVPYKVTTKILAGSTYNKVAWTDRMSKGLTFNKDVKIATSPDLQLAETDYTLTYSDDGLGFVLVLTESGLRKLAAQTAPTDANFKVLGKDPAINGQNTDVTFTITYSSVVNDDAIIDTALENTNTLHYGNNPGYTPEPGDNEPEEFPNVKEITVNKSFTNGPLSTSEATTWPEGLEITLKLQVYNPGDNTWSDVAGKTLTLNSTTQSGKFENLDDTKTYKVVEVEVKGWVPNYQKQEDGSLKIVNKKNDSNPEPITPDPVTVRTGGKKFVKTNLDGTERLAGAEFVVKNNVTESDYNDKYLALKDATQIGSETDGYQAAEKAYQDAIAAHNKYLADNPKTEEETDEAYKARVEASETFKAIAPLKEARDKAYEAMNMQWKWVDTEDEAFKFITNEQGQWEVVGLAYGDYKFVEVKAPAGYAEQKDEVGFTVNASSYSTGGNINYAEGGPLGEGVTTGDATQITNKKVTIPQTGGIGTLIFTVAGVALMGGAAVAIKKNNDDEDEDEE
ncbi:isopeptide-forming domain-containing fimbrial protein [Peptoniphilus sp. KCTC 25270]|uniref:pilin N-terminal domain-containing protein n=1 Tax=Peptoniphilus sp. KCTC 25270 TaxID=2897414 RepID=UPI001E2C2828|nr:isopeptide-forming domain-containing fimbrial protein [Peptoniphilus sp. KCTC 25270]MCD1147749.1 isopeptide-forming domain-containing fimbrial protein [Peptoniphilus sp. KCTC 25270]